MTPFDYKKLKYFSDKLLAFFGIFLSAPIMMLCALAIRLSSRGPVFFRQERLGKDEKPFVLFKFRSMIDNAERETGPKWAAENDPRITVIGKFLRKTRLDELPQLFNVLKGDMSFVGPRPIRKYFADILAQDIPHYSLRFTVNPGITGWAQVCGDYAGSMEGQREKFEFDLYYIEHQSIQLDFLIIIKTIKTVLSQRGQ
ncbi:MAG: exopolysaccharide biosynthesis polyprenyl glycosylphosphotransferase [Nitrospira sp.]|nr:exopolysaccharide biosynthesis polyprenyl glycosylphosphotransferase [Nitrospira sp.]